MHTFFTGLSIGIVFGIPLGAVGALTVKQTLSYGRIVGLCTGIGSSLADGCYAGVWVFAVDLVSDFIGHYQRPLQVVSGLVIIGLGAVSLKDTLQQAPKQEARTGVSEPVTSEHTNWKQALSMFVTSFVIGITNPSTIVSFALAFSLFRLSGPFDPYQGWSLVLGILSGTLAWWLLLVGLTESIRDKSRQTVLTVMQRSAGIIMIACGLWAIAK